jgi:tRNA threonylcarbamoyl adenosine modification protein YjeE
MCPFRAASKSAPKSVDMSEAFAAPARRTFSNEAELRAFAGAFARRLRPGDVVAFSGPLGAGKTTFVRAIVEVLHGADETTSPTFTFRHRYDGTPPVDHLDLYRIEDPAELVELGLEDAFEGGSIVLVEWWRNAPNLLPARRYEVDIQGAGDGPRLVELREPA